MSIRHLQTLLRPQSVALIGASSRPGSLGAIVLRNVLDGGFAGTICAVNPHPITKAGVTWAPSVEQLPIVPDLAVVMAPAATVPGIIAELGTIGCRQAIVISAGLTERSGLRQRLLDAARPHGLRIVGPNCIGLIAPHARLNASFASCPARPGRLALISQSGALVTAVLDWAETRGIGFSGIVSAGDMADVDLGDLIDLFAVDSGTDAILLYVEGVTDAPKFMSAARAAACGKPVIAIKAGRTAAAAKAAMSHTGALAGAYDVYRAAFDRAGIVTVDTLTELFDAAEILCQVREADGDRIAIVTNGGGAGILAVDALGPAKARLADLSARTIAALDGALPAGWSRGNPIDVIGDGGPERYRAAIRAVLDDEGVDALLVMNCATALASPGAIAAAVADEAMLARGRGNGKPVLACWLGDENCAAVRDGMRTARIPLYDTPDDAVRGFGYLLAARRARAMLRDDPADNREIAPARADAERIIAEARAAGRTMLSEVEAKALLAAYRIPVVPTRFAPSIEAVGQECDRLAPPYAVKIVSPQLSHKSDVGGVALGLPDRKSAMAAARAMEERIRCEHSEAEISGFAVETMCARSGAHEMILGIATDPAFGPLLMVGAGGKAVEILDDKALALPPIDHLRARSMIDATRISRLLHGYRDVPPADLDGIADVLDALSSMACDLPDIVELDINPLLVGTEDVIALDARVRITADAPARSRLAIRPAPVEWTADLVTRSGVHLHVRPVRADDEPLLADFFALVTPEDLRFRFLNAKASVDHDQLARMTRVDYRRTITFLAFGEDRDTIVATAMLAADPDRTRAEVALATRADMKRRGISWTLFEHVMRYAKAEHIEIVEAVESADHAEAIAMEREMGFVPSCDPDDATIRIVRRTLVPTQAE